MAPETLATNLYLGRVIATARQRKGLTQNELAEASSLGRWVVIEIEAGRLGLSADRRAAIVRALGLQTDAFDAPGFVILSPEERQTVFAARQGGQTVARSRLLRGRLRPAAAEAAPC